MPSNFDEKMPLDYDKFCPLKTMAFMIIKGNIICWHFLKALSSADTTPLYSEGNNSIFLRGSFFPYNLRAFHTTVYLLKVLCKGTFLLEDTNVFVITPYIRRFFFPETESLNFGDIA